MSVDLSGSIYTLYKDARIKGDKARKRGADLEAAKYYNAAARWLRSYADSAFDAEIRKERLAKANQLQTLAKSLSGQSAASDPGKAAPSPNKAGDQKEAQTGEDDYEEEVLQLIHKSEVRWDQIGGLKDTKDAIKSAYALALAAKPQGVEISSWRNLLLYGPPGTGKTLLAAATAGNLQATFFNVKVSSLLSKYFGESTKLISALYSVARRLSPAVIFLDEFESLTPARGSGESGAERRIVSTLLAELDGLQAKDDDSFVLTICATNLPWLLDLAILSRFQRRIYVPLPDSEARNEIIKIQLTNKGHQTQIPMEELVRRTEGYAGREIEQIGQIAINQMIRRTNPDLLNVVDQGLDQVSKYQLKIEPLSESDMKTGFEQVKPLADKKVLQKYIDWQDDLIEQPARKQA
jgi:SpoVK/Ycf46/Vps4 family AAA+-type ATPase